MLNIDETKDNLLQIKVGDYDGNIEERKIELRNEIVCAFDAEEIIVNLDMDNEYMNGLARAYENFYEAPTFYIYIEDGQVIDVLVR